MAPAARAETTRPSAPLVNTTIASSQQRRGEGVCGLPDGAILTFRIPVRPIHRAAPADECNGDISPTAKGFAILDISADRNARIVGQENSCCTTKFQRTTLRNVDTARVGGGHR
jgi:hypothetical protein